MTTYPDPIDFTVHGTPAPQGSKRHVGNGILIESSTRVKPWREAVKQAALDTGHRFDRAIPLIVHVTFFTPRPKSHYRTGKNAHLLRDNAPKVPVTKPDSDKLLRAILDAITDAGLIHDDAQITDLHGTKRYADPDPPRAHVAVSEWRP